jgi:hypothetical protein
VIPLDTSTRSLMLTLDGNVSTTQLDVVAGYYDVPNRTKDDNADYLHAMALTTTNNSTHITVVPVPPQGVSRIIDYVTVHCNDVSTRTVSFKIDDAGTKKLTMKLNVTSGQTAAYESDTGWYVK